MVRIASSFLGAAIAFSSFVAAAPAVVKRQDIVPAIPAAAGGEEGLNTVGSDVIPTGVDVNGSLGGSVELPSPTEPVPPVLETPPVQETEPPVFQTTEEVPPPQHTSVVLPQYGSGSSSWQVSYGDCVQTCFATHPLPATVVTLPPHDGSVEIPSGGGEVVGGEPSPQVGNGNGKVHNVLVEPAPGTFRFVPAFLNAEVGDSVVFEVSNGQHSIVQSNAITPCNATANGFNSGVQIAKGSFTFVVQNTDPTFFFSDVGTDCQVGLFGGINAATGLEESPSSVNSLLPKWAESDADIKAALDATNALAAQTPGLNWGGKIDASAIAPEYYTQLANNILFTRSVMGNNADMIDSNGVFNPTSEVIIPADRASLLAVANAGGYPQDVLNDPGAANVEVPTAANNIATPSDAPAVDGAGSIISSSRVAAACLAVFAAVLIM